MFIEGQGDSFEGSGSGIIMGTGVRMGTQSPRKYARTPVHEEAEEEEESPSVKGAKSPRARDHESQPPALSPPQEKASATEDKSPVSAGGKRLPTPEEMKGGAVRSTISSREATEGEKVVRIISKLALSSANVNLIDKLEEEEKRLEGSFDDTPRLTKMSSGEENFQIGERKALAQPGQSEEEGPGTVDRGLSIRMKSGVKPSDEFEEGCEEGEQRSTARQRGRSD